MELEIFSGLELQKIPEDSGAETVEGLFTIGATLLAGDPKVGKSTIASQLAHSIATAAPFLGVYPVCRPGSVLHLALEEDKYLLADRMRRISPGGTGLERIHFCTTLGEVGTGKALISELDRIVTEEDVKLVIVDPLVAARPPYRDGNVYQADYEAVRRLNDLGNRHEMTVLIVHHTNKKHGDGDGYHRISGTNGLAGGSCSNMVLKFASQGLGELHVTSRRMKGGVHYLTKRDDGLWITGQSPAEKDVDRLLPATEAVYIRASALGEFKIAELKSRLPDLPPSTVSRVVSALKGKGRLVRTGRGVYMTAERHAEVQTSQRLDPIEDCDSSLPKAA